MSNVKISVIAQEMDCHLHPFPRILLALNFLPDFMNDEFELKTKLSVTLDTMTHVVYIECHI